MTAELARRPLTSISGKVPPHDLGAEAAVIAAVLCYPQRLDSVGAIVGPEHFYSPANGLILRACLELQRTGRAIDSIQVVTWLRDREKLAEVGGVAYVAELIDATPAAFNVEDHAKTVLRKARLRAVIRTAHEIVAEGYGDVGDEEEWIGNAEQRLSLIAQDSTARESVTIGAALQVAWRDINAQLDNPTKAPGVPTGLRDLDNLVRLYPSRCTTIGGFWGDGKSALGLQFALSAASEPRSPKPGEAYDPNDRALWPTAVLIVSVEMESPELAQRALFSSARVDASKMHGRINEIQAREWAQLHGATNDIGSLAIWIDDNPDMTINQFRATVRKHRAMAERQRFELRLVVVDYLQLLNGRESGQRETNREQEVSRVARTVKLVSRENRTHVVALAQLNDDANKGKEARKPTARDFRESKAIAMHSDNVILIHNPHSRARAQAYREGTSSGPPGPEVCELILDKHRGGRTGTTRALFHPSCTLFTDYDGRS